MKKTASLFVLFAFLGAIFLSPGTYAQEVVESGDISITRSEPIVIWDRETWEWWASIKEVYLSWDDEFVNLSEISTWDVCGEWYHLITWEEWENIWEMVWRTEVETSCINDNVPLWLAYTLNLGLTVNYDYLDVECVGKEMELLFDWDWWSDSNSVIGWIYYDLTTNTFKNIIISILTDPDTGDSKANREDVEVSMISNNEPLICIWEEVPVLESEIKFINEDNDFEYKTKVVWWEKLSQEDINYISQNNLWYYRFWNNNYWYWFRYWDKVNIENEEFKSDSELYAYKPIDKENITYKGPYNIEDRKNNEIIATIKEVSINVGDDLYIQDILSTDNICWTGFHFFSGDNQYWEGRYWSENWHWVEFQNRIWDKVPSIKMDLYLDKFNRYPELLVKYFPNYTNALGFLMLADAYIEFLDFDDVFWNYFKLAEPISWMSVDIYANIYNYFNYGINQFMETSISKERDAETWEYKTVVWEEILGPEWDIHWNDFLCIADEVMQLESEVVFINGDNNFEYRTRMSSWGMVSQEDLDYINEENSDYLWYVADVVDIDIENEGFDYNTVVTARKPVEIKDTEKGEVVKLKSVQNSPYFADDFNEYEDEVTWFYDREDVCGQKYHIITWDELADLIISWNLSEDEYNWWGDNTLTYCVSDPYVIVTFKNEDNQSEYEIYVEKWNTMKSWDINKITKNNTWYEWYDGDVLIDLTWTIFNDKVTLYASKIKEPDNNQSHSSGWGWWGGWNTKIDSNDTEKSTEQTIWSQDNPELRDQASTELQNDSNTQNTPDSSVENSESKNNTQEWQQYSEEFQQAYKFAKWNWITTMPTIQDAKMNQKLTRIQMAKMLSQYAINILWKTPDTSKSIKFKDVTEKMNSDYDNWVSLAYQLWIMWINMKNNKFRPNDEVTRGEFATALSRLLFNTQDWAWKTKYYEPHIAKLLNEWIITNPDPRMKELRGYVMIMLMRSAK